MCGVVWQVGILDGDKPPLLLTVDEKAAGDGVDVGDGESDDGEHRVVPATWKGALGDTVNTLSIPYSEDTLTQLAAQYSLVVTEKALVAVTPSRERFGKGIDQIRVFARMSPQGKAKVIRTLQYTDQSTFLQYTDSNRFVLMCGDGGNDVGALKQSDVGLALLSGYGNVNTVATDTPDAGTDAPPSM